MALKTKLFKVWNSYSLFKLPLLSMLFWKQIFQIKFGFREKSFWKTKNYDIFKTLSKVLKDFIWNNWLQNKHKLTLKKSKNKNFIKQSLQLYVLRPSPSAVSKLCLVVAPVDRKPLLLSCQYYYLTAILFVYWLETTKSKSWIRV